MEDVVEALPVVSKEILGPLKFPPPREAQLDTHLVGQGQEPLTISSGPWILAWGTG